MNFYEKRRKELGLSQNGIARQIGVTDKAVAAWEKEIAAPRLGRADDLARAYRVSKSKIISEMERWSKESARD